jgi:outer membrane murein-binding lipoprotein Lpp
LRWVEKELKLNKGTDDDSGKKQRTKKLLKKLRMELLVGRKATSISLRDTRMDVETKEKTLRSKFEPYAKGRAAAERDVKIARIENIRANTRVKAINKVLKQLVAKYIESKKALKTLEVTCMNQTKTYRQTQTKHEEELHTIEHLRIY